jgi:dTDP-4-amino-4,6-dideoxygalactose transaminase
LLLNSADERKRCLEFLNQKGISAVFHYIPLHSSPAGIKYGKKASSMKNTDECSERLVRLPIWAGLPDEQHQYIIDTVFDFFS